MLRVLRILKSHLKSELLAVAVGVAGVLRVLRISPEVAIQFDLQCLEHFEGERRAKPEHRGGFDQQRLCGRRAVCEYPNLTAFLCPDRQTIVGSRRAFPSCPSRRSD